MTALHQPSIPGRKQPYFNLPSPTTPGNFKCIQMQIPDYPAWELQFREVLRRELGSWFSFERDEARRGRKIAQIWRYVESTIRDCSTSGEPSPDDECCEPSQDIFDEFDADNIEDLYEKMTTALTPFIGQVTMGIAQPTQGNWLKCDGSSVNKADWPQLYDLLSGVVSETELTFALPDFRNRLPMGASDTLVNLDVLETAGQHEIELTVAQLPSHDHTVPAHIHTVDINHFHTIPSHSHSVPTHSHTIPSHSHSVTIPDHSHTVQTRDPGSAFGSGHIAQQASTTANATRSTSNDGGGEFNTSSSGGGTTGETGGTTSESGILNTNSTSGILNTSSSGGGATGASGGGAPLNVLNPVIGIHFFIYAGSSALQSEC